MKMIRNNKVYVQKRDLSLIFGKPFDISYYIDESLGLDFVEILDDRSKKMVLSSEFIINYDEFCCESYEKIKIFIGKELLENDTYIIKYKNERVKGIIEILKYNEKEEKLDNVVIGLYAKENIYLNNKILYQKDELIDKKITKEGKIIFSNLELGEYYIKELQTSDKYILDNKKYDVNLIYKDEDTKEILETITIKNYPKKGKLIFNKIDSLTKLGIENTLIEIYKDDELIYELRTSENGQIILDLEIGKYYLIEKEASLGYNNNNEKIEFTIEYDKETNIYMENDFIIEINNVNNIFIF